LLAVDVRERHAERVELALRKRRQRPAAGVGQHLVDGGNVEVGQRAGNRHRHWGASESRATQRLSMHKPRGFGKAARLVSGRRQRSARG
jgi:hypothetical protein